MRCISLWNPWAHFLVTGLKRVETRPLQVRSPASHWGWAVRGPLLIHAAATWNRELEDLCRAELHAAISKLGISLVRPRTPTGRLSGVALPDIPFGAIVGRVTVVESYPTTSVTFDHSGLDATPIHPVDQYAAGKLRLWHEQKLLGDFRPGRIAILCADAVKFDKPIPFRGQQGPFEVPDELLPAEYRIGGKAA